MGTGPGLVTGNGTGTIAKLNTVLVQMSLSDRPLSVNRLLQRYSQRLRLLHLSAVHPLQNWKSDYGDSVQCTKGLHGTFCTTFGRPNQNSESRNVNKPPGGKHLGALNGVFISANI